MSAVSKKVMPASRAAVITARLAARSIFMPKLLHPRPTRLSASPDVPSGRFSILSSSLAAVLFTNRPRLSRSLFQFDREAFPGEPAQLDRSIKEELEACNQRGRVENAAPVGLILQGRSTPNPDIYSANQKPGGRGQPPTIASRCFARSSVVRSSR